MEKSTWMRWIACTALWYPKKRTSSKAYDQIFALTNIFPELMDKITFSYDQPLHDLMFNFYRALAQKDISVLLFGTPVDPDAGDQITTTRQSKSSLLPSWTGANGVHVPQFALKDALAITVTPDYTITGDCMCMRSNFITARVVLGLCGANTQGF
ncbi:hypothetical protein BJV82DRAFT_116705 [Fennellomyces sp. T-0311]|nr:hypothetical protein BJV82DRAFT_116705 [Fennellomyces sp. T-0311]